MHRLGLKTTFFGGIVLGSILFSAIAVFAVPPTSTYAPGQTLDPNCIPTSTNCSVAVPIVSGSTNYVPKFTAVNTLGNSLIQDNGSMVNIGYSPGAFSANTDILEVSHDDTWSSPASDPDGYSGITIRNTDATANTGAGLKLYSAGMSAESGIAMYAPSTDNSNLGFYTENNGGRGFRMLIRYDGHVGIGNLNPTIPLQVGAGSNLSLADTNSALYSPQIGSYTTSGIAALGVGVNDGTNNRRAGLFVDQTNSLWGLTETYSTGSIPFVIQTGNGEVMRISPTGNVGIGTTNPQRALHVAGASSGSRTLLALENTDTTNGNAVTMSFRSSTTGTGATSFVEFAAIHGDLVNHNNATFAGGLSFWTTNNATQLEPMVLKPDGTLILNDTDTLYGGTGTEKKFFYNPSNGTFRVGAVSTTNWDSGLGGGSAAFGIDTKASGSYSMAWGLGTTSSNIYTTAWGNGTTASNSYSTSWGTFTTASGAGATTWGLNTIASSTDSTAWGVGTNASNSYATAWGNTTTASGLYSTAWGYNTTASEIYSTAWGYGTTASNFESTAWGISSIASGVGSTAWGDATTASSAGSTAGGDGAIASTGNYGTAWGNCTNVTSDFGTAWGYQTSVTAKYATAFGANNTAAGDYSTVFGKNYGTVPSSGEIGVGTNATTYIPVSSSTWNAADRLFTIGSGGGGSAADALTILKNGHTAIGINNFEANDAGYLLQVGTSSTTGVVARFKNSSGTCDINPTTTSLVCSSDIRLKKNIVSLTDALSRIDQVRGVLYNWNTENDTDQKHDGFVAQELETVFPELVATDAQGYKSVAYTAMTPILAEAIKELDLKVQKIDTTNTQALTLQSIATYLADSTNTITTIVTHLLHADRVETDEVCVGDRCISAEQFNHLLDATNTSYTSRVPIVTPPTDSSGDTSTATGTDSSPGTSDTSSDSNTTPAPAVAPTDTTASVSAETQ